MTAVHGHKLSAGHKVGRQVALHQGLAHKGHMALAVVALIEVVVAAVEHAVVVVGGNPAATPHRVAVARGREHTVGRGSCNARHHGAVVSLVGPELGRHSRHRIDASQCTQQGRRTPQAGTGAIAAIEPTHGVDVAHKGEEEIQARLLGVAQGVEQQHAAQHDPRPQVGSQLAPAVMLPLPSHEQHRRGRKDIDYSLVAHHEQAATQQPCCRAGKVDVARAHTCPGSRRAHDEQHAQAVSRHCSQEHRVGSLARSHKPHAQAQSYGHRHRLVHLPGHPAGKK